MMLFVRTTPVLAPAHPRKRREIRPRTRLFRHGSWILQQDTCRGLCLLPTRREPLAQHCAHEERRSRSSARVAAHPDCTSRVDVWSPRGHLRPTAGATYLSDQIMVRLVGGALCCVRSMGLQKYLSSWEIATFLLGSEGSFAGVELGSGLRIPVPGSKESCLLS
ncbi:Uncharacterised protein [Chlamydia trachomatis]|nr:Uncharacterised protein [Chlamydia trachomatis]